MRLFIAINFSPALKNILNGLLAELKQLPVKVKWVNPDGLHLTLRFLGEVLPQQAAAIASALQRAAAGIEPWHLEVRGIGVFPNRHQPRVIWAGVEAGEPLYILHRHLDGELQTLGFKADTFTPHITLGRVRPGESTGELWTRLAKLEGVFWGREKVTAVSLMESRLTPTGARYRPIVTVDLTGGEDSSNPPPLVT